MSDNWFKEAQARCEAAVRLTQEYKDSAGSLDLLHQRNTALKRFEMAALTDLPRALELLRECAEAFRVFQLERVDYRLDCELRHGNCCAACRIEEKLREAGIGGER